MHGNATSRLPKLNREILQYKTFTGEKIMERPPSSLDQNPIENVVKDGYEWLHIMRIDNG